MSGYVATCGCEPSRGFICRTHCQWQGCTRNGKWHTSACKKGERVEPQHGQWWFGEPVPVAREA